MTKCNMKPGNTLQNKAKVRGEERDNTAIKTQHTQRNKVKHAQQTRSSRIYYTHTHEKVTSSETTTYPMHTSKSFHFSFVAHC